MATPSLSKGAIPMATPSLSKGAIPMATCILEPFVDFRCC